jgi:hypothetical protein
VRDDSKVVKTKQLIRVTEHRVMTETDQRVRINVPHEYADEEVVDFVEILL